MGGLGGCTKGFVGTGQAGLGGEEMLQSAAGTMQSNGDGVGAAPENRCDLVACEFFPRDQTQQLTIICAESRHRVGEPASAVRRGSPRDAATQR